MKQFEMIRLQKPKKSVHDRSHELKSSFAVGALTPVLLEEVIPGDKFKIDTEVLLRAMPMLAPMMHRVNVYLHYFYVPYRIIWNDWEKFITGGRLGTDAPNHPKLTGNNSQFLSDLSEGGLADHLGFPVGQNPSDQDAATPISQLPFRAYQQIYNDYYRDQNLIAELDIPKGSTNYVLGSTEADLLLKTRIRSYEKDYFTSVLPTAQRGSEVLMPLLGSAPVAGDGNTMVFELMAGGNPVDGTVKLKETGGLSELTDTADDQVTLTSGLEADLTGASSTSISDLRRSFALQRFLEKMARGGARYIEYLLHMFGVRSSNASLQRSQYIGGGKLPIQISEVLQTSRTDTTEQDTDVLGQLAGHGIAGGNIAGFSKYFEEHGFVLGILSIIPRTSYMNGLDRIFSKFDRFDYFTPDFAHIGEQPVYNRELYLSGVALDNEQTFGYQPRYSEYRYKQDRVVGAFRNTMDFYHMARKFQSIPELTYQFVECDPADESNNRIWAVDSTQVSGWAQLIGQIYFKITAVRPIPKFGNPV